MTVKELIKQLQMYPGEMNVMFSMNMRIGGGEVVSGVDKIRMKEVYLDEEADAMMIATDDAFDRDVNTEVAAVIF